MNSLILPAIGGALIGAAAVLLLRQLGRITGISGIMWNGLSDLITTKKSIPWQIYFLVGMIIGPIIAHQVFTMAVPLPSDKGLFMATIAGLLVGFGTNFGSGCTSGHGVCGISRLSPRSLIATATFMLAGFITVYIVKQII